MGDAKGKDAGSDAAQQQHMFNQQAMSKLRKQFKKGAAGLSPFLEAGLESLGDVQQGATLEGFGDRLGEIFSGGALDPLVEQRGSEVEKKLASQGLSRSGTGIRAIADIPAQLGLDIENLVTNRAGGLATQGLGAGSQLFQGRMNLGAQMAQLLSGSGEAFSSGSLLNAQNKAQGFQQAGQIVGTALPLLFGSDPRVKENVEEIGLVSFPSDPQKNLTIYQWDWIPEAEGTPVEKMPTIGFMADEVEEKYPDMVIELYGVKTIRYFDLLDKLDIQNDYEKELAA